MNILSAFIVAVSLSMDTLAVTIASGCACNNGVRHGRTLVVSLSFVLAHIIMLSAGWLGGQELGRHIDRFDHWIAFVALAFIGLKMIKESFEKKDAPDMCHVLTIKTIIALSIATSLDALLVGIALSLASAPYWLTLGAMALCVFVISYAGFFVGSFLGSRFGSVMEALGGVALVGVGTKVLLSGLGIC